MSFYLKNVLFLNKR